MISFLGTWILCFSWFAFFAFWGAEKHVSDINPFRPTRYVLMCFRCLEVSNSVRNWNKFKKFKYVRSILQLCQLEIPILIYKLMCQSSFINSVSFVFCEFNRVGSWNEGKTTIIISNSQIELLVSYSRSTYVIENMSFPNSNFEGKLSIMCLASHFDIIESWKLIDEHSDIYYLKKIHSYVWRLEFLWKSEVIWSSHFPVTITTNMLIGNYFLVFKYTVKSKQKISKFLLFLLKLMYTFVFLCLAPSEKYNPPFSKT